MTSLGRKEDFFDLRKEGVMACQPPALHKHAGSARVVLFLKVEKTSLGKKKVASLRALCLISTWQATELEFTVYLILQSEILSTAPGGCYCAIKL